MVEGDRLYAPAALTLPPTKALGTHSGAPEPFWTELRCRGCGAVSKGEGLTAFRVIVLPSSECSSNSRKQHSSAAVSSWNLFYFVQWPTNAQLMNPSLNKLNILGISAIKHTVCPGRNVPDFGRIFLELKYTDITQNTYIQIIYVEDSQ